MLNKEMILSVLGEEFKPHENIEYYLTDMRGSLVDFKTVKNTSLYYDDQFKLLLNEGNITIETTSSNQEINQEFMNKLSKLNEKKIIFQSWIDLI